MVLIKDERFFMCHSDTEQINSSTIKIRNISKLDNTFKALYAKKKHKKT